MIPSGATAAGKNNSLPLSRDKNLHLSFSIMLKLGMKLHILLTVVTKYSQKIGA